MTGPASAPRGSRLGGRLLARVYLYGFVLAVASVASVMLVLRALSDDSSRALGRQAPAGWVAQRLAALTRDPGRLQAEADGIRERYRIKATLYDPGGARLVSNAEPPLRPLSAAELARLREQGLLELDQGALFAGAAIDERGELRAYAVAWRSLPPPLLGRVAASFPLVLLLLAIASVPLARSVVRPLERLRAAARAFGGGDLEARAGIERRDELGDVARAFDEMAAQIAALLRAEKELLANVSHELRTPLARIRVVLELAGEGDPARAKRYLGELTEDLGELERLVDDVLTTARLDLAEGRAGNADPPLRIGRLDPRDLLALSAARFRDAHPARRLEVELPGPGLGIDADRILLRRVVDNLLDNAHKYSDPGSPIALRARARGDELEIEVLDQGIGIDAADLPRLFQPFYRTDRSRARRTGGTGLGLALARRIVAAHGGRIALESRPGAGTRAYFVIPAAP